MQIKSTMRWVRHVARMGEDIKVFKVWVGEPVGKRLLGRSRSKREAGIRADLREIGWGWIGFS
jgi:hypothetical protein